MSGNNSSNTTTRRIKQSEVEWLKNLLKLKSSSSSTSSDTKPQCNDPALADQRAAWNQVISGFKSVAESISNELKSHCQQSKCSPSSTYVFETLHRRIATTSQDSPRSRSSSSRSKTYTVPESSTPTCQLHAGLPSFPHSPIIPAESSEDKKVMRSSGVSRGILKVRSKTGGRNLEPELTKGKILQRTDKDDENDYDYQRSTWQTSGLTRSEIEYKKRTDYTVVPSVQTEEASLVKVCVKSKADIHHENHHCSQSVNVYEPTLKKLGRKKDKDGNSHRYNKLYQDLEHVRRLDYKMRDLMKRLRDGDGVSDENSGNREITIGEVLRDIHEFLMVFPVRNESEESEVLEERIRTHLMKIGHQIRLLEKYNRILIQKTSSEHRSKRKDSIKLSKLQYKDRKQRGNYNDHDKEEQLMHTSKTKTKAPLENPNPRGNSTERNTGSNRRRSEYTSALPNRGGLGTGTHVHRLPDPPTDDYEHFQLNHPTVEGGITAAAATVAYERWTWSYVQPINIYEPHDFRRTSGTDRMSHDIRGASTHWRQSRQSNRRTSENVAVEGNERGQGDPSDHISERRSRRTAWDHVRIYDADDNENLGYVGQTFTTRSANVTRGEERRTLEHQGTITDRQRTREGRARGNVRQRRDGWTLTDIEVPMPQEERRRRNQGTSPSEKPKRDKSAAKIRSERECWTLTDVKEPIQKEEKRKRNQGTNPSEKPTKDKSVAQLMKECDNWTITEIPKEDKRLLEQGTSTIEKRTRDKGVEKMRRKRDGWTSTEIPKAREIEIQTVQTITRSQSRSTRAKGKRKISEKEMRERTARLRANDTVLLEKRLKEEEKARRAANRLLQKTYASKIRSHRKGAGRNIDISTDVSVLGNDDDYDTLLDY
ncbi:unnamed protein product [Orchesella dallaii]|uniref:Uncharacterized protein n=1 Tax=Orchesella dallaii TaxID=48710 RepID=A0ABP1S9F8_9HEXA